VGKIYFGEIMRGYIFILFFISLINAQDWAGFSGGFLRMGMTSRSQGMGGGFTADIDPGFAVFHNPAWAAFLIKREVGFTYSNMTLDRRVAATSIAFPLPPTAGLGLSVINSGVTNIQGRTSAGEKTEIMQTGEYAFMVTFAIRVLPWLSFGSNIKILRNELPITLEDQLTGSGIGFDIGFLIKTGESNTIGIMVQDMSSNYQWNTNDVFSMGSPYKDEFPTIYKIGSRAEFDGLLLVGDIGIITDHDTYMGFLPRVGLEYALQDQYKIRGGFGNNKIGFGFGYQYEMIRPFDSHLDYSYSIDWASQGAHTISYAFRF
tara:strand:+ start:2190 stop:3143 length:954 start_codon:yes stop_codon:yes gene_type:complete